MKLFTLIAILLTCCFFATAQPSQRKSLREVNQVAQPPSTTTVAIVGATLIDGRGGAAVSDSVVIVRGDRIATVGNRMSVRIPSGVEVIDARGLTLLPGLIDSHFHIDGDDPLPALRGLQHPAQ